MGTNKRRNEVIKLLSEADKPLSASYIAEKLSVSRQVIVSDVSILRAGGKEITATPRGYVLEREKKAGGKFPFEGLVACRHNTKQLKEELYTVVDYGGTVIDVTVEHPMYGQLSGFLNINSRFEADLFYENASNDGARLLSTLTDGVHLHRIGCDDVEIFNLIKEELKKRNILLEE